jgi:hypothetical protein
MGVHDELSAAEKASRKTRARARPLSAPMAATGTRGPDAAVRKGDRPRP